MIGRSFAVYVLAVPYFESALILDQLPQFTDEDRVLRRNYPGGHMFYSRDASRAAFRTDAENFLSRHRCLALG